MAQAFVAFTDNRNYLYVLENNTRKCIEYQGIKSFKTGKDFVIYINAAGALVIYQNNRKQELEIGNINKYEVSENIAAYIVFGVLKVFDNGTTKTLSIRCSNFTTTDYMVVFQDDQNHYLSIYRNGETFPIADIILHDSRVFYLAADNMTALFEPSLQLFYIFNFENRRIERSLSQPLRFDVGLQTAAFFDVNLQEFVYIQGEDERILSNLPPFSFKIFKTGLLYISAEGNLMYVNKTDEKELLPHKPDQYMVKDSIAIIQDASYFYTLYNNDLVLLETYMPSVLQYNRSSIAYVDKSGQLILWQNGKKTVVSSIAVRSFELLNNAVIYRMGIDNINVFANGKRY